MCEQCATEAIEVAKPLRGWTLYLLTRDFDDFRAGQYALTGGRGFDFVLPEPPRPAPPFPEEDGPREGWDRWKDWAEHADRFGDVFDCSPVVGHELFRAMRKAGYDGDPRHPHGKDDHVLYWHWLVDRIGRAIAEADAPVLK